MKFTIIDILIFIILTFAVICFSRRNIFKIRSHGFYRFLSWECIVLLFSFNYRHWFANPFGIIQLLSWFLLILSCITVILGVHEIKKSGKAQASREGEGLYAFEKTTELVDSGIFRYIRHPLYASLFYLTWGIFFKHISLTVLVISILSSIFLYLTAKIDEKECVAYFGEKYTEYMKRSRRFAPFVF